jgi:hypothetical protein
LGFHGNETFKDDKDSQKQAGKYNLLYLRHKNLLVLVRAGNFSSGFARKFQQIDVPLSLFVEGINKQHSV